MKSRGYSDADLDQGEVLEILDHYQGEGIRIETPVPLIGWRAQSMSGQFLGVQTRQIEEKAYRWFQGPDTHHLPILYGTPEDFEILYRTKKLVLAEGPFDRKAVKLALPDHAVLARLSKGVGKQIIHFIRRYADHIWLAFDMDEPGRQAIKETKEKLADRTITELEFPRKDPSKVFEDKGLPFLRNLLQKQIARSDFG